MLFEDCKDAIHRFPRVVNLLRKTVLQFLHQAVQPLPVSLDQITRMSSRHSRPGISNLDDDSVPIRVLLLRRPRTHFPHRPVSQRSQHLRLVSLHLEVFVLQEDRPGVFEIPSVVVGVGRSPIRRKGLAHGHCFCFCFSEVGNGYILCLTSFPNVNSSP